MEAFLKGSHVQFGTDNTAAIQSVTKSAFQGAQPNERYVLKQDQMRDFRATHFDLAHQKDTMPESTQKSHFAAAGASALGGPPPPCLPKASFYMDQALSPQQYLDTYNSMYKVGLGNAAQVYTSTSVIVVGP